MADALPGLRDNVSFVVDGKEAVGPQPLDEIIRSIREGKRKAHSLVWWADASGWQFFDDHPELVELLSAEEPSPVQTEILTPEDLNRATVVKQPPAIDGLFSANARKENGLSGAFETSKPEAVDAAQAVASARSVLANAERDPSSGVTRSARHDTLAAALSGPSALVEGALLSPATLPGADLSPKVPAEEPTAIGVPEPSPRAAAEEPESHGRADEQSKHHQTFEEMVKKSGEHQRRLEWATRVDELMLSGCIAAVTERGYLAMDLSSRGSEHEVLFESEVDSRYVVLQILPLPQLNAAGEDIGSHLQIKISWGQHVTDVDSAFATVRSLASDEPAKPGKVRAEIDAASSRVYTTVDLILAVEDFVSPDYDVDSDALDDSVAAALHILERRWYKLFIRRR